MLAKLCLKYFKQGFSSTWTNNFQMYKLGLENAEESDIKLPTHSLDHRESKGIPKKHIYFHFIDYDKAFNCMDHNKMWKILKEIGVPDHLACLLRNLYVGQEAIVRIRHGTTDYKIRKGVWQGCLSPWLFNIYAEYIIENVRLGNSQARIRIAGRNINNLGLANDTTLMAQSEEEVKSLLMKVKEESEKAGLKLSIQKTNIMTSSPITSWQIEEGKSGSSDIFSFLGLQNHCRQWLQPWNLNILSPWKESYDKPRQRIKKQRHHFADKIHIVSAMVFPVVMYGCESWIIKMVEC